MLKVIFILILFFSGTAAIAQVPFDSLRRSVKRVNIQETILEDHAQLYVQLDSIKNAYMGTLQELEFCNNEKELYEYERKLRHVLDLVEQDDFKELYSLQLKQSTDMKLDTFVNGTLGYLTLVFESKNYLHDGGELKPAIPLEWNILNNDAWLKRFYPKTSKLLNDGIMRAQLIPRRFSPFSQVSRIIFPPLIVLGNLVKKKEYAANYLRCISIVCDDPTMKDYSFSDYILLEQQEVPNQNLDKLLGLRIAFIKILKDVYYKKMRS